MSYEYRKLSPKEREEIVSYRRARGYPLYAPPHPFRDAGAYLISAANFEHKALMKSPERRTEFEMQLLNTLHEIADDVICLGRFAKSLSFPSLRSIIGLHFSRAQAVTWHNFP